ncbi:MAG: MMPL family transporter [Acidimicrobiia bacterium]|nr:MMPL family transporter [Acidimicrobiia bacterium]MDH5503915.1 MMPL family transporter [Acidimicrobiia bacterium]
MDRIAKVIVSQARIILIATAILSLLSVAMLFRLDFNPDVSSFILEGNATGEVFANLQEKYTAQDPITVVATASTDDAFNTPEGLARLAELQAAIASTEGVESVASIIPAANPLTGAPITPEDLRQLPAPAVSGLLDSSPTTNLLLSADFRDTLVIATPGADSIGAARNLADLAPPDGIEITMAGNPVIFASVVDLLGLFLLAIPPLVIGLMLAVFYANIGDRRLAALAMLPAILGSLWTFGLLFGLGRQVDIVTVIVPIFVIVMGSADGLHFVTHFQEEAHKTSDPATLVASALRQVGVPMILTTISTGAGFLSLLFTGVHPIAQLGTFSAIGITFAGIISFVSLPALLSRLIIKPEHHNALLGPWVTKGLRALVRTRRPALVITLVLVAFAALTIPSLGVNSDQLFFFKDDDPVRLAFAKTEAAFGGATPLIGEFAYDPSAGSDQLSTIRQTSDELRALPGVREVFSLADLEGRVPAPQFAALLAGDVELPLGRMASDDGLRFVMFPENFTTADLALWKDYAANSDEVRALTGMPIVWDEIARLVVRSQVVSLIVAFVLVTAMLGLAYRRLRQTVASLVPIILTVATLLGFLAFSETDLNLMTAVLSSIVIGVGIDYAIHFIAAIDLARQEGPGTIDRAIERAGRPIVANALGIAVAFTALWLSPLKIHNQLSVIMQVSMVAAALTALVIIPALLDED